MNLLALVVETSNEKDADNEVINIDLSDVLYMDYDPKDRAIIYYHKNGKVYKTANKLMHFETSASMTELGFVLTDRSNMVNMNHIEAFDRKKGKLLFKFSKWLADVARINYSLVEFILKERNKE